MTISGLGKILLFNPITFGVATGLVVGNARATSRKETFEQRVRSTADLAGIFGMLGALSPIWVPIGFYRDGFNLPFTVFDTLKRTANGEPMRGFW